MSTPGENAVDRRLQHYPLADITPAEFEKFVVELFESTSAGVHGLRVTLHDKIEGTDGTYDFDATIRFESLGMAFLVLVEAKKHKDPIKRELVQVLRDKIQSVGAHKGVLISTSYFQRGALMYALKHGIALVTVTEGRFTFETKSVDAPPELTRAQAAERFDIPTFVGHCYSGSDVLLNVTLMSIKHPEYVGEKLLGVQT